MSKKKIFDMGKNTAKFIPDIWSQKVLSKFLDLTMMDTSDLKPAAARSLLIKELSAEIKRLSGEGFSHEQIAEKINPDTFDASSMTATESFKIFPWKTWGIKPDDRANDRVNLGAIYGKFVIKPERGPGFLGGITS